jgi:hypothetical protein
MPLPLERCAELPAARVGGKAKMLGAALRARFPVPPGVVIEPAEQVDVNAVVAALGKGPFAVRSSSPHEDRARASWAGQFATRLWVTADALPQAFEDVRASGAGAAAQAYGGRSNPIPALVQPIVSADDAGVMFTIDPARRPRRPVRGGSGGWPRRSPRGRPGGACSLSGGRAVGAAGRIRAARVGRHRRGPVARGRAARAAGVGMVRRAARHRRRGAGPAGPRLGGDGRVSQPRCGTPRRAGGASIVTAIVAAAAILAMRVTSWRARPRLQLTFRWPAPGPA